MSIIDKFLDVMRLNDDDYEFDNGPGRSCLHSAL